MVDFFQQIFSLLINPPGNLTYYLVVAFSIVAAMPGAYQLAQSARPDAGRRTIVGLSLLLAGRLILFLGAALAWQGLLSEQKLLPTLDRLVTLLSLVLILWLWTAPGKMRSADAATALLAILVLTAAIFSLLWWSNQASTIAYNASWPDQIGESLAALLCLGGILLLGVRRPPGWGMGLSMLTVLAAGHLAHLVFAIPIDGDYPGAVRLAQMIAYPFLLVLPQRFSAQAPADEQLAQQPTPTSITKPPSTQPDLTRALLEFAARAGANQVCRELSRVVAQALQAEICLVTGTPDRTAGLTILCGYDRIKASHLDGSYLEAHTAAALLPVWQSGEPLQLTPENSPTELRTLTPALKIPPTGEVLGFPLQDEAGQLLAGLILISPPGSHHWTRADLEYLAQISKPAAALLQRSHAAQSAENELARAQMQITDLRAELRQERQANRSLRSQINDLQTAAVLPQPRDSQAASFAALLVAQEDAQELIKQLRAENERLHQEIRQVGSQADSGHVPSEGTGGHDTGYLEGELRLALEEIARLNKLVSEADQRLLSLQKESGAAPAPGQSQAAILSLAIELRQPLSAIAGYTDFLLGESVGILGALQRKFLERVKTSTQRMSRLVDDLIVVTEGNGTGRSSRGSARSDVNSLIDQAIEEVSSQLQVSNLSLEVEIAADLPNPDSAGSVLQGVLSDLLANAIAITPAQGIVTLRAKVPDEPTNRRYLLFQVSDQGGGIPAEELPGLFTPPEGASETLPGRYGPDTARMHAIRGRVEALNGRIWVDSQPGTGSTFSVLVPACHRTTENSTRQASQA